jgi:uncharacterized protein (TIGR02594 family)
MNKPLWLTIAEKYIGTEEFKGLRHNQVIVGFWKLIKRGGIKDDETPWCAAFVGGCLEQAGIVSSRFEGAASYLKWGNPIPKPLLGCIAVISRPGGNHVFFVAGVTPDGKRVIGLGGNQSDKVRYAVFDAAGVKSYRWPAAVPPSDPAPTINPMLLLNNVKMD